MPFLKTVEIKAPNGMKSAVSEDNFNPSKHKLWTAKDEKMFSETIEIETEAEFIPEEEVKSEPTKEINIDSDQKAKRSFKPKKYKGQKS